jgi:hypothetical protein
MKVYKLNMGELPTNLRAESKELLSGRVIIVAEQIFETGDICHNFLLRLMAFPIAEPTEAPIRENGPSRPELPPPPRVISRSTDEDEPCPLSDVRS